MAEALEEIVIEIQKPVTVNGITFEHLGGQDWQVIGTTAKTTTRALFGDSVPVVSTLDAWELELMDVNHTI